MIDIVRFNICSFLQPEDLLVVANINKNWYITTNTNTLWLRHVLKCWDHREYNCPHKARGPGEDHTVYTLLERVTDQITLAAMKKALRQVDTGRCTEKKDWRSMLCALLVFKNKPSLEKRYNSTKTQWFYPDWALVLNQGKATYIHAKNEAQRTNILKSELTAIPWEMTFKDHMYGGNPPATPHIMQGRYYDDYTIATDSHNGLMNYTMHTESDGKVGIQVENFPVLHASKLDDGRWSIENCNATFVQPIKYNFGVDDAINVPLL